MERGKRPLPTEASIRVKVLRTSGRRTWAARGRMTHALLLCCSGREVLPRACVSSRSDVTRPPRARPLQSFRWMVTTGAELGHQSRPQSVCRPGVHGCRLSGLNDEQAGVFARAWAGARVYRVPASAQAQAGIDPAVEAEKQPSMPLCPPPSGRNFPEDPLK
jgi:hypothetical protein